MTLSNVVWSSIWLPSSIAFYMSFRELQDDEAHTLARLADRLAGRGVQDMEIARREIELEPIRLHLRQALTSARAAGLSSPSTGDLEAEKT